jgi:hypothetical protein
LHMTVAARANVAGSNVSRVPMTATMIIFLI